METAAMRDAISKVLDESLRKGDPIQPDSILHQELEDLAKEPAAVEPIGGPSDHILGLAAFRLRRASRR